MGAGSDKVACNRFLLLVAGLGGLLYGIDIGFIDLVLGHLGKMISMSEGNMSVIVVAVLGGSVVAGFFADLIGRKLMRLISAVMFVASVAIIFISQTDVPLLLGRILQGMSGGVTAANHAWRGMFLSVIYPGILFLVGGFFVSESPRWLYRKGRKGQACACMLRSRTPAETEFELAAKLAMHVSGEKKPQGQEGRGSGQFAESENKQSTTLFMSHPFTSPMETYQLSQRIAVCSWSLQPADPSDLLVRVRASGINRVQLALDPLRDETAIWGGIGEILRNADILIVSGMFGCIGEDYSTLDSIRVTGGISPDSTWEGNLENIRATVRIAAGLGLELVTFHAGFVPHDSSEPAFFRMVERLQIVADLFAAANMSVGLETGQETAAGLAELLAAVDRPNVFVNFDPANMLLYGKGDPIEAVRLLAPWIRQVHVKDAVQSPVDGQWGEEVAVGTGQVEWPAFFAALAASGYNGDFVIEREAGKQRIADVCLAREVILKSFPPTVASV
jgi:L-ribulose-5-phosphate 3-epimerase